MSQTASLLDLENMVQFESNVKTYKIDPHLPLSVEIIQENSLLKLIQSDLVFVANLSPQIIHRLSALLFINCKNNYYDLKRKWDYCVGSDKNSLVININRILKDYELSLLHFSKGTENIVYGFIDDNYQFINQLEFRNLFLEAAGKTESLDLNSKFVVNIYGDIIEQFDYKVESGRIKLSYLLNYVKNNGYNTMRVIWGREVIVCSNGLTKVQGGDNLKFRHVKTSSISEFIECSLREGIVAKNRADERIDLAIERPLYNDMVKDFINRIYLSEVSKEKIRKRLKIEIENTGNNEWSLSQALTWLGAHDDQLMETQKDILTQAGSMIFDHSLYNFWSMNSLLLEKKEPLRDDVLLSKKGGDGRLDKLVLSSKLLML